MKTLKTLNLAIFLTSLLMSPAAFAGVCDGGSCTGGGNMIDHSLIEDFARDAKDLPHYGEIEKFLKLMDERVPDFAKNLRSFTTREEMDAQGVQHYLIPRRFKELDPSVTGLHFKTDQVAYQKGREIFVSEEDAKNEDPETMGKFYFRELIEMAHPTKDAESVRKLMIYLKANRFAPPQDNLVNMLQQLGFGKFETKRVHDEKLAKVKEFVKRRIDNFFYYADRVCDAWVPTPYFDLNVLGQNYKFEFGVSTEGGKGDPDLDPRLAPLLREYMTRYRNELWKNEHFASFHAALDLEPVKLPVNKILTGELPSYHISRSSVDMAYWYAGYTGRLAYIGDLRDIKSTLTPEAKEKISRYEEKYKNLWNWDRKKQACADLAELKKQREGFTPEKIEISGESPRHGDTGAADAQ